MPWGPWPDDITTNELVTSTWLTKVSQSLAFMEEVAYTAFTSPASITATTEGTAQQVVSSGAVTYENVPHLIEFYCPRVQPVASGVTLRLVLEDVTTVIGHIGRFEINAAGVNAFPVKCEHRLTPTAASHTYNVRGYTGSGTGSFDAGNGGAGLLLPGFIRVSRIAT